MRFRIALLVMCGLSLPACSKNEEAKPTTTTTATSASAPVQTAPEPPPPAPTPPPPAEVETSTEMKGFLALLDGKPESTKKALKQYGGKTVQNDALGSLALKDPKVTKSEKLGTLQCYSVESTAGATKHTSRLCWDGSGKIAQITDKKE
ncbi:hypothetical protein [Pendulispora albinea]|uniref:Uncharacterized protein n=1 Tax=Pendulispora albinea TaxID=2741071 RepID=A0ABZ2LX67_9BACT